MNHKVHIIESPGPYEFLEEAQEGGIITRVLQLGDIPNAHWIVVNRECFEKVIEGIFDDLTENPHEPIIHISGHGSELGITLTNDEVIDWKKFQEMLKPISAKTGGGLILCFSTCFGANGWKLAMSLSKVFKAAVGPVKEVEWDEAAVAYRCFYHLLLKKGVEVEKAAMMMNLSVGSEEILFRAVDGDLIKKEYLKGFLVGLHKKKLLVQYLKTLNLDQAALSNFKEKLEKKAEE